MLSLLRFCCCAFLGLALLAGAGYGAVRLTRDAGLQEALSTLAAESRRDREMTCREDALQQVLRVKGQITPAVIDSNVSLAQAVAAFRASYEANPACMPGEGLDDYRLAYNVLSWVRAELAARGATDETVLRRLEAEMRELHDHTNGASGPAADVAH